MVDYCFTKGKIMENFRINVADSLSKFEQSGLAFLTLIKDGVTPDITAQGCTIKDVSFIVKAENGGHGMGSYTTRHCEGVCVKYGLTLDLKNTSSKSELTGQLILKSQDLLEIFKKLIVAKVPGLANKKAQISFDIQNTADDRFGGANYEVTKVTISF